MRTIQSVLYQRNRKARAGTTKIRPTEDRKTSYVTTGEKLPTKFWNAKSDRAREVTKLLILSASIQRVGK